MKNLLSLSLLLLLCYTFTKAQTAMPNILWIVSEDNSPYLGCYGDELATTPNIDQLAAEGMLYTHAFSNAPVCAPARHTIITGTYANGNGTENMRSSYPIESHIQFFPTYLKEKGYYTANRRKKDYNTIDQPLAWDESGREAHYSKRKQGQPFFQVVNFTRSHESSIHGKRGKLIHDPAKMNLPPYHPDVAEIRKDWAWYYDRVTHMDALVGQVIAELKKDGLYDDTIIFYYSDHGGVLARSKRYLYDSGQRVPFIVRVPEKYQSLFPDYRPQSLSNRLISFVDLAPTVLSLAGIKIPPHFDGKAFNVKENPRDYVYGYASRFDSKIELGRSVRNANYLYTRYFLPERPNGYKNEYQFRQATMNAWKKACENGDCNEVQSAFWKPKPANELFDCANDPHNVKNLSDEKNLASIEKRLDQELRNWMTQERDKGIVHELERRTLTERAAIDDWTTAEYQQLLNFAIDVAENKSMKRKAILKALDKNIHYQNWMLHYLVKNKTALHSKVEAKLLELVTSEANSVKIQAAFLLLKTQKDIARKTIDALLSHEDPMVKLYMLDILQYASREDYQYFKPRVIEIKSSKETKRYDVRIARYLEEVMQ